MVVDFPALQADFSARHKAALDEIRADQKRHCSLTEEAQALGQSIASKLEALAAIVPPAAPSGTVESNVIARERKQN